MMPRMLDMYINGKWVQGEGESRSIIDPSNGLVLAVVSESSLQQVDEAVCAAKAAFEKTEWSTNKSMRVRLLRKLAERLDNSAEEFAQVESQNTGKPIRESRLDIGDSVACLRYYADLVESRSEWQKEMFDGTMSHITDEPIGVCALIVPWNFPLLLGMWKLAPALAAGNTVIFKPSELTPLSFLKLAILIDEMGIPTGVFNLVLGDGASVGQPLVSHKDVDKVSFTGGSETGKRIYQECAKTMKRVSLELGGKSPLLVFEDADVETAVDWALFGSFFNQGQVCVASSRILVQRNMYGKFVSMLSQRLSQIRIGDPLEESTEMGPLVSHQHLQKMEEYIRIGKAEGATLLSGGNPIKEPGFYITPAVFINVHQEMRIVQEEIFGPVITVQAFDDQEEAVALANGTKYGLAAGILSRDVVRAKQVAAKLRAGTVWINGYHTPHVEAPWGGFKQSGIGRELGPYGLSAFTEPKHTNINHKLEAVEWYSVPNQ